MRLTKGGEAHVWTVMQQKILCEQWSSLQQKLNIGRRKIDLPDKSKMPYQVSYLLYILSCKGNKINPLENNEQESRRWCILKKKFAQCIVTPKIQFFTFYSYLFFGLCN